MAYYNMAFTDDQCNPVCNPMDDNELTTTSISDASPVHSSSVITKEAKPEGCFTFIDFCPQYRRKPDSWFFQAEYENFSEVFNKINDWLNQNPKWRVNTAETLIYDSTTGFGQRLSFIAGKRVKRNIRAIRLWLIPRLHQRTTAQKIGCINVVPRIKITNESNNNNNSTKSSFLSSTPNYESLDEMLVRVNDLIKNKPINGRILNVETVPISVESNQWSIDTELCYWSDECQDNTNTVYILRIYFEYGTAFREHLEIIDFVPRVQIWDTPLAVPVYETFSSILSRSSQWIRDQEPGLRFLSCNTVEVPVEFGFSAQLMPTNKNCVENSIENSIESRKMFYLNGNQLSGCDSTQNQFFLKFIRLAVARPQSSSPESYFPSKGEPVVLNCKIFVPSKIPSINSESPDYESINISKRKIEAWLMTTGAKILSAETSVISIPFSSSSIATSVDSCLKSGHKNILSHYLTIYRIYLDGHYLEPPARLLPLSLNRDEVINQNESCLLM